MVTPALPSDLANLPKPELIEELDFEILLKRMLDKLKENYQAAGLPYDVDRLRSDPQIIRLETATYSELLLRQRINEAARAQMLPFAYGGDLDILGAFYDVTRLINEDDIAFRRRIILSIQGRSTGGTEARYKYVALSADVRVADAVVYTVGRDPTIRVAIYSKDNYGQADAALLASVDAALQSPTVRMVNDRIIVASAVQQNIDIEADIWLLPHASAGVVELAEQSLRKAWQETMVLGRDLTMAWWVSKLMIDGVHRILPVLPAENIVIPFDKAATIRSIKLNYRGRDY